MLSTWLDQHAETFVRPKLGFIPNVDTKDYNIIQLGSRRLDQLKNVWEAAKKKAGGRMILLPGRDVFLFEVLARMEEFPTIFRPDISTLVSPYVKEDYTDCYLLDTGYKGTIAKDLKIQNYGLIEFSIYSQKPEELKANKAKYQVMESQDGLAGVLEGTPKYWQRGYWHGGRIIQKISDVGIFSIAAQATFHVGKKTIGKTLTYTVMSLGRHL
jgi:hypothetical protein